MLANGRRTIARPFTLAWPQIWPRKSGVLASEQIEPTPLAEEEGEPSRTCGRRLLVDMTKAGSPTQIAQFSDFLARLVADGYAVSHFAGPTLDAADLANVDVVFIAVPEQKYGATELAALETFVDRGGGLVFLADFGTPPGETIAPDWFEACAELAAAFNVTIADLVGLPSGYVIDQNHMGAHPISQGLTSVGTYAFTLLAPGEPLLLTTATLAEPERRDRRSVDARRRPIRDLGRLERPTEPESRRLRQRPLRAARTGLGVELRLAVVRWTRQSGKLLDRAGLRQSPRR